MAVGTILFFLVVCFCLGFTATFFVKNASNFLERNLMRLGFGLSLLPFVALILNILHIPIDWRIILFLSAIYPAYFLIKHFKTLKLKLKITKYDLTIILMLIVFLINFYVYASGAFSYPYLENDDSWGHAETSKSIAEKKSAWREGYATLRYADPYPPTYGIFMGIMHQTNDSMYWTLKFFNALIISLSTIFFFFFVYQLTMNRSIAFFSAFFLFAIPSYLSHFIWALALTMPLFFVTFYAAERIQTDRKWAVVTSLVMVTTLTSSPSHSAYFGFFFAIYFFAKMIIERKFLGFHAAAGIGGVVLSFLVWWIPMFFKHGVIGTLKGLGLLAYEDVLGVAEILGTGDRVYNFSDFFVAQGQNLINNPVGIGKMMTLLLLMALLFFLFHVFLQSKRMSKKWGKLLIKGGIGVATLLLVIGIILFLNSDRYDVRNPAQSDMLKAHMKSTLFFLFLSFAIMIVMGLWIAPHLKKNKWTLIALMWLLFSFYAVNATLYPYKLSPFRAWMVLAIPVCMLASYATFSVAKLGKSAGGMIGFYAIIAVLLSGAFFTSAQQKIEVNTANWPPGGFWTSGEELGAYLWIKDNIPKQTKIFAYGTNGPLIGFDMYTCHWCEDVRRHMRENYEDSAQDTYDWLKQHGYEYVIIDGQAIRRYGANVSNIKIQEMASSGLFTPAYQNQGMVFLKLV